MLASGFQPAGICSNALILNPNGTLIFFISFVIWSKFSMETQDTIIPSGLNFSNFLTTVINFSPDGNFPFSLICSPIKNSFFNGFID